MHAIDGAGPGRRLGGGVLARRGRHPSRRRARPSATSASTRPVAPSSTSCARWAPTSRSGRTMAAPTMASASRSPTCVVRSSTLRAVELGPADVAAAIDEIPILCLAAAGARPARRSSAAPASCATRNRTGSRAPRPACARSARGSRSTATTSASTAGRRSHGAETDSLDDHRLAMTFAIAGLVASGETIDRPAGLGRRLLSRLLRRPRKGASMTKRVVLIGHPVAHSLSGAMQQAAFDAARHRRQLRAVGSQPDGAGRRDRRAARPTTSSAPTSRSRTRNGSCRWSTG